MDVEMPRESTRVEIEVGYSKELSVNAKVCPYDKTPSSRENEVSCIIVPRNFQVPVR